MAGVDLGGGGRHKKGHGPKKPKRIGFSLDMTPLVDVAFLLLTFFMFATTMSQPQIMEISIPPDIKNTIEIRQSELLTLFVSGKDKVYYNTGLDRQMKPIALNDLAAFSKQRNAEQGNALITILKVDTAATYAQLVNVMDQLNVAEGDLTDTYRKEKKPDRLTRERKFSLMPMEQADRDSLAKL